MERWPNLFIVGAPKAGTTSLHEYLNEIPGIFMSSIKEPNFFNDKTVSNNHLVNPIRDKEKYLILFKNVKEEKILGESSVWYLADPDASKKIHKIIPNAKIIISIRDPVERAFSHYLMHNKRGNSSITFHDWIQDELKNGTNFNKKNIGVRRGLYSSDLVRYLDIFGEQNVKILIFEEWIINIKDTINEILKFLDLDYQINKFENKIYNASKKIIPRWKYSNSILKSITIKKVVRKIIPYSRRNLAQSILMKKDPKKKMNEEDRITLIKYYEKDVKKLENLLGRKLPWPNFTKVSYLKNRL